MAGGAAYAAPQPAQKAKTAKTEARSEVQARSKAMFARLDTNHDGFITDAEVAAGLSAGSGPPRSSSRETRQKFRSGQDVRAARHQQGRQGHRGGSAGQDERAQDGQGQARGRQAGVARLFARVDSNKDGAITLAELSAAPRPQQPGVRKAAMNRGGQFLDVADSNKDGKVSLAEMQAVAFQQFDRADANHDGKVTPEERKSEMQVLRAQHKPS